MEKIKKNYLYNMAYQILVIVVPLITTPYVSRVLGSERIGVYSFVNSITTYFVLFANLSFSMYGQREVAYNQKNIEERSIRFWEIQLFKTITFGVVLVIYVILSLEYKKYSGLLLINCAVIIGNYFDVSWYFQGLENFKIITIRNFVIKLTGCILIFSLVKTESDLALYFIINAITTCLGFMSLWLYLPKYLIKVSFNNIRILRNIKNILELFIPMLASNVYNVLDKTMLGLADNRRQSGYYEQTTKIIALCMALITAIGPVVYPRISAEVAENNIEPLKKSINKIFQFVLIISCPIFWGVITISDSMCSWFFGADFVGIETILKLYAVVLLIIPLSLISEYAVLTPLNQQNKGSIAVCLGALCNFGLNYMLIPRIYAIGASIATIIAETIVTILHLYFIRSYICFNNFWKNALKYFSFGGIMFLVVWFLFSMINIENGVLLTILQIVVGAVVYLVLILLSHDELAYEGVYLLKNKIGGKRDKNGI